MSEVNQGIINNHVILEKAKDIEHLLTTRFSAVGDGLGQKMLNVEARLTPDIISRIKSIVHIRNKISHERGYFVSNAACSRLSLQADEVLQFLGGTQAQAAETKPARQVQSNAKDFRDLFNDQGYLFWEHLKKVLIVCAGLYGAYVGYRDNKNLAVFMMVAAGLAYVFLTDAVLGWLIAKLINATWVVAAIVMVGSILIVAAQLVGLTH